MLTTTILAIAMLTQTGSPKPAVAEILKLHPEWGTPKAYVTVPDWAEGPRQRVEMASGRAIVCYLDKAGDLVSVREGMTTVYESAKPPAAPPVVAGPPTRLVPVDGYRAGVGDVIHVYERDSRDQLVPVLAPTSNGAVHDLVDFLKASDQTGLSKMPQLDRALILPSGTPIRILSHEDLGVSHVPYYQVRIEGGEHKDKRAYILASQATLCKAVPVTPGKPAKRVYRRNPDGSVNRASR